jgi:hypothetical protein
VRLEEALNLIDIMNIPLSKIAEGWLEIPGHLEYDENDAEQKYLRDMVVGLLPTLEKLHHEINRFQDPVMMEGTLVKNEQGRFQYKGTSYLITPETILDVWDEENGNWTTSKIEKIGNGYTLVGFDEEKVIAGLKFRKKR